MRDGALSRRLIAHQLPQSGNGSQSCAKQLPAVLARSGAGEEQGDVFTLVLRENDDIARLRENLAAANEAAAPPKWPRVGSWRW